MARGSVQRALVGHLKEAAQLALGAVEHEAALPCHLVVGVCIVHQQSVRFQRQLDEGFVCRGDPPIRVWSGVVVVGPQRAEHVHSISDEAAHAYAPVGGAPQKKSDAAWQFTAHDGFALDDAGGVVPSLQHRPPPRTMTSFCMTTIAALAMFLIAR